MGSANSGGLAPEAGSRVTHLVVPIIVQSDAKDNRAHVIATSQCILQTFQCDNTDTTADNGALRVRIERSAVPIRRENRTWGAKIAATSGSPHRHSPG